MDDMLLAQIADVERMIASMGDEDLLTRESLREHLEALREDFQKSTESR